MPQKAILEFDELPRETVLDLDGIRKFNRQRYDWEMLDGVTLLDFDRRLVVGYKDCRTDEAWTRGHFPERPMLPGVLMVEAGAQTASIYVAYFKLINDDELLAFGGIDDVRFRGEVRPGQRLWIVGQPERNTRHRAYTYVQGFVDGTMVFHAKILGVAIKADAEAP
jgi:3-hydroxyacyl-[acyl-carrier-protein] dehydratase